MLGAGLGIALYPEFNLASLTGLNLVYIYSSDPVYAFLVTLPAFRGIRPKGSKRRRRFGATQPQFWRSRRIPGVVAGDPRGLHRGPLPTPSEGLGFFGGGGFIRRPMAHYRRSCQF
jgi:hypothetical protein